MQLRRQITLQRGVDITKEQQRPGEVPVVSSGGPSSWHDTPIASGPGVVVGRKGSVGTVHWVSQDYWPHDTTLYVKWFGNSDRRFVYYKLVAMRLETFDTGSANPTVNRNLVHPVRVVWPRPSLQRAIADFLDRKTAAIDALIEKKEGLIALLAEKRAALIHQAVTKGLDPDVPMKDSGVPWIGAVPTHWDVKRLKFVCRLETGHTPSRSDPSFWIEAECTIPWVSLNDTKTLKVNDYIGETVYRISERGMAHSSAHLLEPGAVVFTRDATIGLTAITTTHVAVSQHIIAWLCRPGLDNRYLLRVVNAMTEELDRLTFGATIKTIGMGDVKELVTPCPPLSEQGAIVASLGARMGALDDAAELLRSQIDKLREYRQALITAAVTGQITIPEDAA